MKWTESRLAGVWLIEQALHEDARGYFARSWCQQDFAEHGIAVSWVQSNLSFNRQQGTLRGLHYQQPPHAEAKLVYCLQGQIYDVVVDLRPDSSTFGQWQGFELSAENHRGLYIPAGMAHGFQTLCDHCLLSYQMSAFYQPGAARGIHWQTPRLKIDWPLTPSLISAQDQALPEWLEP